MSITCCNPQIKVISFHPCQERRHGNRKRSSSETKIIKLHPRIGLRSLLNETWTNSSHKQLVEIINSRNFNNTQ